MRDRSRSPPKNHMAASTDAAAAAATAEHKLLVPPPSGDGDGDANKDERPLVIFFHGSGGETCSPSWDELAGLLTKPPLSLRVLLYDRTSSNPRPEEATADLRAYLVREKLWPGPYILIAHSYGGAFARTFIYRWCSGGSRGRGRGRAVIAGVVLVETGQEGGLDLKVEEEQYRSCVLGGTPLSVVRGNSLIGKWKDLEAAEAVANAAVAAGDGERLRLQREMLRMTDEEDERLKKRQLDMSRNARYVHVPDCGHHVIRDRPDVVAAEVSWILENMDTGRRDGSVEWGLWVKVVGKLRSMIRI